MKKVFYFICLLLLAGCARSFHTIYPSMWNFHSPKQMTESVTVSYIYDVQELVQNKPYARKERKKNIQLISVRIENKSDKSITLNESNFKIKTGSGKILPILSIDAYTRSVRQYSGTFLLFYGISGLGYYSQTIEGKTTSGFTYNFIPAVIGAGNAIFAGIANEKQKENLMSNWLLNKKIEPNATRTGLVAIEVIGHPELFFTHMPYKLGV